MPKSLSKMWSNYLSPERFYETTERLIEKYNPFFGRKFHKEDERWCRLAKNMVEEGGIINHLKYFGSCGLEMLYFTLMWPEIGIRAAYKQLK